MVKSLKYYLNAFVISMLIVALSSCDCRHIYYQKSYTEPEKLVLSESLLNGAGTDLYYQGTVGERLIIMEGNMLNPNNAWGQRELGVPYLKRGFAYEANKYYTAAINADPEEWLGYKSYCWLYFYRDYETVIKELDIYDNFTPDFVDYPQSTSVDYMRGLSYLKLEELDHAISFLTKHLSNEIKNVGHEYIEAMPYQLLGIAYYKKEEYLRADSMFQLGLRYNANTADLYYYRAKNLLKLNRNEEAVENLNKAEDWLLKGSTNQRLYVEEFYSIYKEDILKMRRDIALLFSKKDTI